MKCCPIRLTPARAPRRRTARARGLDEGDGPSRPRSPSARTRPAHGRPRPWNLTGARRLMAAPLAGFKKIMAIVTDRPLTEKEVAIAQLAANRARKDLTPIQHVEAICRLVDLHPDLTGKAVAQKTGYSEAEVSKCVAIGKCPVARAALSDGRLKGLSDAYAVAKAEPGQKTGLIALRISGAKSHDLGRASRKRQTAPAEKVARIPISLPDGISVVLSGKDMDIEQAIQCLTACLQAAKKARDDGISAKSWAAGMHNRTRRRVEEVSMYLMRCILIVSVLIFAYVLILVAYFVPYGWAGVGLLVVGLCRRATRRLHAYGTSRWADGRTDLGGLVDE